MFRKIQWHLSGFSASVCLLVIHLSFSMQRITIEQIRNDEWFQRSYVPVRLIEYEDVNLDDVNAVFDDPEVGKNSHSNLFLISCFFFLKLASIN